MKIKGKLFLLVSLCILVILLTLLYLDRLVILENIVVFRTIQELDTRLLLFINPDGEIFFFNQFFLFIATYLDLTVPIIALILLILSFYVEALKKYQVILFIVLIVFVVNSYATNHLKDLFGRARPQEFSLGDPYYFGDINPLEPKVGYTSFPSGHTSTAFSLMVPLIIYVKPKWLKMGFLSYACLQGIGRIWLGAHFPSDVLFGAIIGTFLGLIMYYIIQAVMNRVKPEYLHLD